MGGSARDHTEPLHPIRIAFDGFRGSIVYFSRIPAGRAPISPAAMKWAAAHLPAVGAAVGCASAAVLVASASLGHPLSAALSLATSILLTGAIHEDGLADTADGLGAGHGGKKALEIMRDSRLGAFGAIAIGLSLLLRFASLSRLSASTAYACVLVHCLARIPPVWLLSLVAPVGNNPSSPGTAGRMAPGWLPATVATCWAAGVCALLLGLVPLALPSVLLAGAICLVVTWLAARTSQKALGGLTGDVLGATEQVAEICLWVGFLASESSLATPQI